MNPKKLAALLALLHCSTVWALEPFVIKDIRVEGIQRTEPGAVFSYLPVKVGDTMDDTRSAAAIRALYGTGFFKDVRLEVEQGVLIVMVSERPTIGSVRLDGIHDFPADQLKDSMKYVGLAEGRIFDKNVLDKAVQDLKRQYVARGKYGVTINPVVTPLERNRVAVSFEVQEGEVSKIKQINIVGNQSFPEEELLGVMKLRTPDWFSWISKNDQYSKPKLTADLEALRSYYMDRGFMEFNIESTQVSISPDKKDIYITVNIHEGDKYVISKVDVGGNTIVPKEELLGLVQVKPGDEFSRKRLSETSSKIGERLGQEGYAAANVMAMPDINKEKHEVAFNFLVDPLKRVYVRRVNVFGNTKTRDEVIRREFRQLEGAWFDGAKIKKSKQRADRLGFFSEVNLETPALQGVQDQMDINVTVKEKATGSFTIGGGINSGEGLVLMGGVTQSNLFGTGNYLATQVNTSKINTVVSLSFTDPYYTDDGVSRGFDVYKRKVNAVNTVLSQYTSSTLGGAMRFGVPVAEDEGITYGLSVERTTLGLTASSPARYVNFVNTFGATNTTLAATAGWYHDSRNSAIDTTEGTVQRANVEMALPVMNMRYVRASYEHQWFYPLMDKVTLMLNGQLGAATGYGGKQLPFFKNLYAGGVGSVRGFDTNSLGPRDASNLTLGGNRRVVGSSEVFIPFPGMGKDGSVRLSGFVDGGAVYGPGDLPGSAGLRYSSGLAFTWISPMGPFKLSYGIPLNAQPNDRLQKFQFTLGSMF